VKHLMPREFYMPKDGRPVDAQGTDAAVFIYEMAGVPYAIGFHGKASKPDWHHRFKDEERRAKHIADYIAGRKSHADYVAKQRQARKAPHSLKVGDLMYSSWGYDQTNIDFYEVVQVVGVNSVKIRKVKQALAENQPGGPSAENVVPMPGEYCDEPMLKRVSSGNYISLNSYSGASKWNGQPKSQTASGWGH